MYVHLKEHFVVMGISVQVTLCINLCMNVFHCLVEFQYGIKPYAYSGQTKFQSVFFFFILQWPLI